MSKTSTVALNILDCLNKYKIDYAILRNWEFLKNSKINIGKDIDLVVDSNSVNKIDRILRKNGFFEEKLSPFSQHKGYVKYISEDSKLLKFHFHVGGVSGRHIIYLGAEQALSRRAKVGKYFILSKEDLLLTLIIHSPGSDRYSTLANSIKNFDNDYLLTNLEKLLGVNLSHRVFALFVKDFKLLKRVRNEIRRKIFLINPIKVYYGYIMSILWYIPRLIKGAPLITFIGMDGAGKSTATKNIINLLKKHKISSELVYVGRGKNNILPIQFFGRKYKKYELQNDKLIKNNHNNFKRRLVYSFAAPIYYLDFMLRYSNIFLLRRTRKIVITDRFGTDLLLMKYVPLWLRRTLYNLMPKPELIFYLYSDVSKLYSRKPLHPKGDLERQEKLFKNILPNLTNVKFIRTRTENQTVKDISNELFALWLKYYSKT
ncbi:MAG: hypothetical protein CXT77_00715 [uncultured DHVE6 group euryarchaeote]|nr:MAG: hypothetical protein CXT77_00715 [uncultured DHVE6 group euryarchaeote]